jgi:Fe2+ or Zn2+ uptake regulation protein
MNLDELFKTIKESGLRMTSQRLLILQALVDSADTLVSAESLLKKCIEKMPATNMTTVYRNLEALEKLKLLHKTTDAKGTALYKLICSNSHHHHIQCMGCGKILTFDFCPIAEFQQIAEGKRFRLTDHHIELFGYCESCQKNKE